MLHSTGRQGILPVDLCSHAPNLDDGPHAWASHKCRGVWQVPGALSAAQCAALRDAAEDIINDAVPGTLADLEEERAKRNKKGLGRLRRAKGDGVNKGSQPPGGRTRKPKGDGLGERLRKRYRDGRR